MTQKVFEQLRNGDMVVYKDGSDMMEVMIYDFFGNGEIVCFCDDATIYPNTEFSISEWFLSRDRKVINE